MKSHGFPDEVARNPIGAYSSPQLDPPGFCSSHAKARDKTSLKATSFAYDVALFQLQQVVDVLLQTIVKET
jgi:hypothetical protein